MESVTFVYSLATEQERQTEAVKNQNQNQLDKYRALIQKQMEKERAFLSFKKVEFLCKQEAKLGGRRPLSARARMGDSLPGITTKAASKNWFLGSRSETRSLAPSIYRQRTHLGMKLPSTKPASTNTSPIEVRKPCLISNYSSLASSRTHKDRKNVHFETETKATRSVLKCKKTSTNDSPKEVCENGETFRKRTLNPPKCERLQIESTNALRKKVSEDYSKPKEKENARVTIEHSRSSDLNVVGKAEDTAAKAPGARVSWAVVARLIGLKMKFKRRQFHGTFQAPELEVLDPSLKNDTRFDQRNQMILGMG
ncbi:hypothetical protein OS493_003550 [Desmophyllum pertusum]|uniref:Uncharacterized protein n=1 Tax=Desmophyllum pertusum TaxID=174260 RepID=A0A9X0DCN1_9CNID|nr:hypothetical protein OS493_003550 [Desmophyllum pertusum]